jgi:hypothetical protein
MIELALLHMVARALFSVALSAFQGLVFSGGDAIYAREAWRKSMEISEHLIVKVLMRHAAFRYALQYEQDLLLGVQRFVHPEPIVIAQHEQLEIHAVVPVVPAAAGRLEGMPAAGDHPGDRPSHRVLVAAEYLIQPVAGVFDRGFFRSWEMCHGKKGSSIAPGMQRQMPGYRPSRQHAAALNMTGKNMDRSALKSSGASESLFHYIASSRPFPAEGTGNLGNP